MVFLRPNGERVETVQETVQDDLCLVLGTPLFDSVARTQRFKGVLQWERFSSAHNAARVQT